MKKPNTKQHIIDTASKLFYKNGYNATGINEIIAESKIAKATLYHHFKSKENICIAYLEQKQTFFLEELKEFIDNCYSSKQKLLGIYDFLRELYRKGDFYGCWGIKTLGELPPENENVLKVIQNQKKELIRFLEEIVKEVIINISIAETERIAGGIYLLYESAITESHLHKNDWPIHLAKSITPSLFIDADLRK